MSNSLNKVFLLGNIGADPELRQIGAYDPCLKFSLATTEQWRDRNDAWQKRTEWHRIELWGKRAEPLSRILAKGMRVMVEGTLRSRSVDGQDGRKRHFTDVRAHDVWLTSRPDDAPAPDRRPGPFVARDDDGRKLGDPLASPVATA